MSDMSMEQTRAQSDDELIRGGAIKSPDGHLAITDEQCEPLHNEMESDLLKQRVEEAQGIIAKMDSDTFEQFQKELQYSLKYWNQAFQSAQTHILGNEGEQQKDQAYEYYFHGKERIHAIVESPLYVSVRERMKKEYKGASNLPKDWVGWLGISTKQDIDKINEAIGTIFSAELPIAGLVRGGVSEERLSAAKNTIQGYGIRGVFVQNPSEIGLVAAFHEHFAPKPQG